uniref:Uncharacterized protein n=1 Tax=Davidia involucrata TaxID=16924 RepID=A0A5B7CAZ9_DAVIN
MGWFLRERRGPAWKQSWTDRTLESVSAPPMALVAFFSIVVLLWSLQTYSDYKSHMEETMINLRLLLFLLPVVLIIAAYSTIMIKRRFMIRAPPEYDLLNRGGSSPWGVALVVVLLLVMVSYQSSIHSQWFRLL